jgi:hypothetical protein
MPTVRPRHQLTETDDIAAALDIGCRAWPQESRAEVMRRLVLFGAERIAESPVERALEIELALKELIACADDYPPGYLDTLRQDWTDPTT